MRKVFLGVMLSACSVASFSEEIRLGYAEIGQECAIRAQIAEAAIKGHNGRYTRSETIAHIRKNTGHLLKEPQASRFIERMVDHVYAEVPVVDSFQVGRSYTNLCIENPDQYIGEYSIVNWRALKK